MKSVDDAIIQVESQGNDSAVGDLGIPNHAYGCMQIRQPACDDVNAKYGTHFRAPDMLNHRSLSKSLFWLYMSIYCTSAQLGRMPTDEDRARIWNGGLGGATTARGVLLTNPYWAKVQSAMSG